MGHDFALDVQDLTVRYGGVLAVDNVALRVPKRATMALIGANGAGKTSVVRAIGGQVSSSGQVAVDGTDVSGKAPYRVARAGFAQVPQGRRLFPELTVIDNLILGTKALTKQRRTVRLDEMLDLFPRLRERRLQLAGSLSGGEQQMVAIARALVSEPVCIGMDEPSLGLAPIIVSEVFSMIEAIQNTGTSVLLVEQNAVQAMDVCDHVAVLSHGRVVYSGNSTEAKEDFEQIQPLLV